MIQELISVALEIPIWQLLLALLGGLVPVLIWLRFLESEDKHSEPRRLIALAFAAGMTTVIVVIILEGLVAHFAPLVVLVLWVCIEEIAKFVSAAISVLWRKENDEPIDSLMYMIVTALGFAALENAFFLLKPILTNDPVQAIITGNLRFIGATLLHVVASSMIGIALALSYYKSRTTKVIYASIGLLLAIGLHVAFNFSIMVHGGAWAIFAFYIIWAAFIVVLLFFEKTKNIKENS